MIKAAGVSITHARSFYHTALYPRRALRRGSWAGLSPPLGQSESLKRPVQVSVEGPHGAEFLRRQGDEPLPVLQRLVGEGPLQVPALHLQQPKGVNLASASSCLNKILYSAREVNIR